MSTTPTTGVYLAICKKEAQTILNDNDELPISNIGALRLGFEALQKEDASDFVRSRQLWDEGKKLLADESEDDTGAGAVTTVQVEDPLDFACVGGEGGWGYGGLW